DGTSVVLLIESLLKTYQKIAEGNAPSIKTDMTSYKEFVLWEEAMLESPEGKRDADYWKQQLGGDLPILEVHPDFPRPLTQSLYGKTLTKKLPEKLAKWMVSFSQTQNLQPSILFLGLFKILLHKYTHAEDIIVGMPVSGRPQKKFESVMGYCINMIGMRSLVKPETELPEFFRQLQLTLFDALYHSEYPFLRVVQDLKIKRNSNISPVFQISYAYQDFVEESVSGTLINSPQQEFELQTIEGIYQEDNFDLGLHVFEEKNNFRLYLKYNPDLYREESVERVLEHYCNLIEVVSRNQQLCIKDYGIVTEKERHQILYEFNDTKADYHKDLTIVDLFEVQVEKTPDNIALVFENQQLSYRELNRKSNQLANYLITLKTGADNGPLITDNCIVGICVERSLEMVIGLLGILKAGATYVPLDPDYPLSRLRFMLEDSGVPVLLSQSYLLDRLPLSKAKVVCLDSEWEQIEACS
ncbi:MAG: AMP-binding protein, partial [Planctomycetes bacterium]|nr:AMP-binding protein [Planctomycetota bacterium]